MRRRHALLDAETPALRALAIAIALALVPSAGAVPAAPEWSLPDGFTALTLPQNALAYEAFVPEADGTMRVHVTAFEKSGATWAQVAKPAVLRVHDWNPEPGRAHLRAQVTFDTNATARVTVAFPATALDGGAFTLAVALGTPHAPGPWSWHSAAKVVAIQRGALDAADALDDAGRAAPLLDP